MMTSLFTASTGMSAQQSEIDTISNNLANVNTTGFKKTRNNFQDLLYSTEINPGASTSNNTMAPTGIHKGHGVKLVGTQKVFTQGNLVHTGNDLDLSIDGDGFFQVLRPNGTIAYTRDGAWQKDSDGRIVTSDGFPLEPEIILPPEASKVIIAQDGRVSYLVGDDPIPQQAGSITLSKFINPSGLKPIGKNLLLGTVASGEPSLTDPGNEGTGILSQGFLEKSNVSVVDEMVNMIVAQRAYEVNSKAIQTSDNMLQTAVNIIR
ncbi:MAG: flagellar basal-body rod protein FlgG [SAR324 cluster bacterium]|uniref:Flagellar basal-body rod protein FlgG n=1 Tax=SAR324 cluster bacterium TaxID=2024889 RepID=A0A2A4T833_9DELT|nr:MAG: flagellar basal-body rod protein FlgG [SAR324 cluster bacterium]